MSVNDDESAGLSAMSSTAARYHAPARCDANSRTSKIPSQATRLNARQTGSDGYPKIRISNDGPSEELIQLYGAGRAAAESQIQSIAIGPLASGPIRTTASPSTSSEKATKGILSNQLPSASTLRRRTAIGSETLASLPEPCLLESTLWP